MNAISFNGVNGATGDYLLKPAEVSEIAKIVRNEPQSGRHLAELIKDRKSVV